MPVPFLDLKSQNDSIHNELQAAFDRVLKSSGFVLGSEVAAFEKDFSNYHGMKETVGLNSGTDALLLALLALGVGSGDEVITVANSFYATVEAILLAGAKPVFVDATVDTALMDFRQLEGKINSKTKAIIPVHLYGQPADMDEICAISQKRNISVIEDACQAMGATYNGKRAGTFGEVSCFSFYPGKNLGALGDGGALVTNNAKVAEHARKLRNHGGIQKYQHDHVGYNSRLDGLQAAFLAIKLKHIDVWNARRVANAKLYCEKLEGCKTVRPLLAGSNRQSNYHLFEVRVADGKREVLMAHLAKAGIASGIHYPDPLHLLPQVKKYGFKEGDFPVAENLCKNLMSLPMFAELSEGQIEEVTQAIREFS